MENGIEMIFVSKWFLIPVKYIYIKITIWPPDNIGLIYLCWVTYYLADVYGKPKGSLRVATTRCFRKQRVALASQ